MLDAEPLQQRRHVIFAVRCSHLRRRPPLPIKLSRVDVPRLVQELPYLFRNVMWLGATDGSWSMNTLPY